MNKDKIILSLFIASSIALAGTAHAIKTKEEIQATAKLQKAANNEKCAGIIRAGLNDCPTSQHACAGMGDEDSDPEEFTWMPKGTCDKIKGTHVINTKEKKNKK